MIPFCFAWFSRLDGALAPVKINWQEGKTDPIPKSLNLLVGQCKSILHLMGIENLYVFQPLTYQV